jgi:hypothetical protein
MNTQEIVTMYGQYWEAWYSSYREWLISGEILGCVLVVGSITVAASPPFIIRFIDIKTIAFVTAVLAGINTFLDPLGRAKEYGLAVSQIDAAIKDVITSDSNDPKISDKIQRLKVVVEQESAQLRAKAVAQQPISTTTDKPH